MRKNRKALTGTVVSDKMDKTCVVTVETRKRHPLYGKFVKRRKKYMIHDEENACQIGDRVVIEESTPISKNKKWKLVRIINKSEA